MKKILASIFLLVIGLCLVGCEIFIEYVSLSTIVRDEEFTSAYVSSVEWDEPVILVDFDSLKEKDFYQNIMCSSTKPTDVLPEAVPKYNLIIKSKKNSLQFSDLGDLYAKYKELADKDENVIFGGRLGQYKYYDMDKVIEEALNCASKM